MSKLVSHRVFTSWVRRGAAASVAELDPVSGGWPKRASFARSVVLKKDGTALPPISIPRPNPSDGQALTLLDPGAVTGLLPKAVVRTDPRDGATGVESNFLVQIEFSRPDLPWMFTPAAANPNNKNRLRPWLVLIVVDASIVQLQAGTPLPTISVHDSDLPDLNDSWGWAHSQVTVDTPASDPVTEDSAAKEDAAAKLAAALELIPASGRSGISRLLCPRLLQPNKTYLACVVPATKPGVDAGLGKVPQPGAIDQAWQAGAGHDLQLPVYYSWRFSTGDAGDFKSLVVRLKGVRPTDLTGFGTRTVNMSAPWQRGNPAPAESTMGLGGALGNGFDQPFAGPARDAFAQRLIALLNFPADQQPLRVDADPTTVTTSSGEESKVFLSAVAPPIYGGRHAGATTVPSHAGWLHTLNVDPRRRIAAAFGTQYVQENQEFLMAEAWNQLGAVQEANRLQALAELAAEVGDRMHRRHIASRVLPEAGSENLSLSKLVSVASPARTRILVTGKTLHKTLVDSPVPAGAATVAFSRFTRSQGPLGRRTFNSVPSAVIETGLSGKFNPPPTLQDGIASRTELPQASFGNATAGMVSIALQTVANFEKALPTENLTTLVLAVNAPARPPAPTASTLKLGSPVLRLLPVTFLAKPVDEVRSLAVVLADSLRPSSGIFKRFQSRVRIPDEIGADKAARVMACPQFIAPLAIDLKSAHPDWLVPGVGNFPDNSVTVLQADAAFVESFLAGANHEMNREFLWRGFPTDQRGTPFRFFWPRPDRMPDIPPITNWPADTALGNNGAKNGPDVENMTVLLVRGELLHRYPRSIAYAAPGILPNGGPPTPDVNEENWKPPIFTLRLDDRTTAFAYNITPDSIRGKPGFYFVFSEPITGPRFNFDVTVTPAKQLNFWSDLDWGRVKDSRGFAIAGRPLSPVSPEPSNKQGADWNQDAADIARIAFAKPFRVAYHADELLALPGAQP